jgi:hypothetical protein
MGNPVVFQSDDVPGVQGISNTNDGVTGRSTSAFGVFAASVSGVGLRATSESGRAMEAQAKQNGEGVVGQSQGGDGVFGISISGIGVHAKGTPAGLFEGDVQVNGTVDVNAQDGLHITGFQPFLTLLDNENNGSVRAGFQNVNGDIVFFSGQSHHTTISSSGNVSMKGTLAIDQDVVFTGGDCAEHFDAMPGAMCEPGTVMAISNGGVLDASSKAYDKRVAGVVSGAGSLRPAVFLDRQPANEGRPPVALVGKVYCKVDADYAAIEVGDLLTTSNTLGHAMKVSDPSHAFGAVIGKALRPLKRGQALIPILIALQ